MSGKVTIPNVSLKPPLDADTQRLITELRAFATSLENGTQIMVEKPRVRSIIDLVLKLAGVALPMRILVVNSKYLR